MIIIENFDSSLLRIDKKSHKNIDIYYLRFATIKTVGNYGSIHSVNPLHLIIDEVDGSVEENNGNKYLSFVCRNKNK